MERLRQLDATYGTGFRLSKPFCGRPICHRLPPVAPALLHKRSILRCLIQQRLDAPVKAANTPGIRHLAFAVEDIDAVVAGLRARGAELVGELERYEDSYRLWYVRGPEGIIIELAEQIG
jgi:catechol 2,3-dioxygenase-like lactoylglutathione lyase family enzyme